MSGTPALRTPFPDTGRAVLLVVAYVSAQAIVGFFVGMVAAIVGHGDIPSVGSVMGDAWVLLLMLVPSAMGMLALGLYLARETPAQFFRLRPFPVALVPAIVVTAVGASFVLIEVDNAICHVLALALAPKKLPPDLLDMAAAPVGAFVLAVVAAPWLEEYFFRGLILRGLLARHRTSAAVILNAVLFGLMHANFRQFVLGTVIGLIFGWWYARTRSVAPGIVGHMVFNSTSWVAAQWPVLATLGLGRQDGVVRHEPWWLFLGGAGLLAGGLLLFHRLCPSLPPPEPSPELPPTDEPPLLDQPPLLASPPPSL
ncbi:MAG TPA: type II CAAX endopeptidase family protein [Opitutaceae bacterium]|nr:type II CAAX endopeptidase family protein [Opitutaceae bacterium]HND59935.1 type II CAAX endopeptidase family protein [Opitutaceae bacterium]